MYGARPKLLCLAESNLKMEDFVMWGPVHFFSAERIKSKMKCVCLLNEPHNLHFSSDSDPACTGSLSKRGLLQTRGSAHV